MANRVSCRIKIELIQKCHHKNIYDPCYILALVSYHTHIRTLNDSHDHNRHYFYMALSRNPMSVNKPKKKASCVY